MGAAVSEVRQNHQKTQLSASMYRVIDRPIDDPIRDPRWEDPEVVALFANRDPDLRLQALLAGEGEFGAVRAVWAAPPTPRVLDIGCAGGRNTVWLVAGGADVWAIDASAAMVTETRRRLSEELSADEAARRVQVGRMDDLSDFASGSFDLVLALGVLQNAATAAEWSASLSEVARVLREGGLCLVANFGPDSRPSGAPLRPVAGEADVWLGFSGDERPMTLPDLKGLDASFAAHGMLPVLPTQHVRVETPRGFRTTLNALYRRGTPTFDSVPD